MGYVPDPFGIGLTVSLTISYCLQSSKIKGGIVELLLV